MPKESLKFLLARYPVIYRSILDLRRKFNPVGIEHYDKVVFLSTVRDGDVVFEVGAHHGEYTIMLSNLVGKTGEVHAFEPIVENFSALNNRVRRRQRFLNVQLHQVAISDHVGTSTMFCPKDASTMASLARHGNCAEWERDVRYETVNVTTLDTFVENAAIKRVDFVKLDVEGAELSALRGASRLLAEHQPILYIEFHAPFAKDFDSTPTDLIDLLCSAGYSTFYFFSEMDGMVELDSACTALREGKLGNEWYWGNLLCLSPARHGTDRLNKLLSRRS